MHRSDLIALQTWFDTYTRSFFTNEASRDDTADINELLSLKRKHSFGVWSAMRFITREEAMSEEDGLIAEATALCAVLIPRGVSRKRAAALGVMTNVSQILMAVVCYTILVAQPGVLTPMLGFAAGAMIYLTVVELLPEAYLEAHQTAIAVTASVAMSVVALLEVVLATHLYTRDAQLRLGLKVDRISRVVFPLAFIGVAALAFWR